MNQMESTVMYLVVSAGNARSHAMEAIAKARAGNYAEAEELLLQCAQELSRAHSAQTLMIQEEVRDGDVPLSLFLIHAQDHVMNAMVVRDLAAELVELYRRTEPPAPE